jgi:hypothetical protein
LRFIAKYGRYQINFQTELVEHYATGESRELRPLLHCEFDRHSSMKQHEVKVARETFVNQGLPTEVDGMTSIDPLLRFSVFDTEVFQVQHNLDDTRREELEQFLLNAPDYGIDFIMVEDPKLAPPWPTYDDFRGVRGLPTPQAIAKKVEEDGYLVDDVIAYERQNANRLDVIDALESIGAPPTPDETLVEA